ncbi:hypothetical protein FB45DRAFT_893683 [Roridomyces roridus]|uniref:Ams2/SPT21 N-terminal domain-containing protein n=1 Tax=Roridomyces roridus TaxID=1738132 RepID=A0AAD7CFL1_9AGAR|nr:hypothetical protein FB45DRAFT_893683 [Roridomyces roridus]
MAGHLPLRILYSLNSSPQYILCKSPTAVPVEFVPSPEAPNYASASLKTCLNTICRSSPEIINDSCDYSVYLLDPLEGDCTPSGSAFETRVAVGMGLMSWALNADETDAMSATGTVKVSAMGSKSLEIIFSLRQTAPMEKAALPETLRSWGSAISKQKGKRPAAPARKRAPNFESDKLLGTGECYTGPERRSTGRPRYKARDNDVIVLDHSPGPSSQPGASTPTPSSSQTDQHPVHDPAALIDILALFQTISPDVVRNKALGNALGSVDGSEGSAVQARPGLAEALRSSDDEIVVLNKENVNPTDFRRRAEREKEDQKLAETPQVATPATQTQPEASTPLPSNSPSRKRTLSQFMADQTPARDKEPQRSYYRQPERSASMSNATLVADGADSRSRFRRTNSCDPSSSKSQEHASNVSASSPARPNPSRQKYVVPAWARTETATQPRLSDHAAQLKQLREREKSEEAKKRALLRRKHQKEDKNPIQDEPPAGPSAILPVPVAASNALPVFAAVANGLSISSPPRPSVPTVWNPPCTPPRPRRAQTATPGGLTSLFTPTTGSWEAERLSVSPSASKAATQESEKDVLGQELDSAFDELDFPPSTQPTASSDVDANSHQDEYDSDDDSDNPPPKQHWVGLPPSSPPPPSSSPFLGPAPLEDDEIDESPLLPSEADAGSELETDAEVPGYSVEELSDLLNVGDLDHFFQSPTSPVDGAASLFDQFTNQDSDDAQTMKDWGLDVNFDASNPDFDFTEFWESVKPLVENNSNEDLEQSQLAGDVQALLSGCLV